MNILKTSQKILAAGVLAGASLTAWQAAAEDLVFGIIPNNMAFPYNVALVEGFEEKAAEKGVKVLVLDSKLSVATQADQMQTLIQQGVDGIAFMPNDSVAAEAMVDDVVAAEVPIVASAVPVGDASIHPVDYVYSGLAAVVSTNDVIAGHVAGEFAASILPKDRTAKIAVVEGAPGFQLVKQRQQGFEAALNEAGIKFEIVSSQPSNWTPESGEQICQNALTANPDIDVIFSHADDMAIGCAKAIDAMDSSAQLVATGGGSSAGALEIKDGAIVASVCTQPKLIGELSFERLYNAATNEADAQKGEYVSYDMYPLTKENVDDCPTW